MNPWYLLIEEHAESYPWAACWTYCILKYLAADAEDIVSREPWIQTP